MQFPLNIDLCRNGYSRNLKGEQTPQTFLTPGSDSAARYAGAVWTDTVLLGGHPRPVRRA